jgi:hypothetical protein
LAPSLSSEPHAEYVALAFDRDAQGEVAGLALHRPALADLEDERVEEDDRVDVVERPLLPLPDVLHHRVGDSRDEVAADLDAVELGQVRLDVAGRHPARVEGEDLVVEALEAPLPLAHKLRLEAALAVTRRPHLDRAVLGRERLRRRAVAGVAGPAGWLLVRLVAEIGGQLRRQGALHQPRRQLREHAAGPDDLLLGPRAGKQLIDHLVRQLLAKLERELDRRRTAGRLLRSPSGLAPHPAGATSHGPDLRLRRHDAPFSSCLTQGVGHSEN